MIDLLHIFVQDLSSLDMCIAKMMLIES